MMKGPTDGWTNGWTDRGDGGNSSSVSNFLCDLTKLLVLLTSFFKYLERLRLIIYTVLLSRSWLEKNLSAMLTKYQFFGIAQGPK